MPQLNLHASASFAIAHLIDILIPKSTPATVGPKLVSTPSQLTKQILETHSYSTLLKKSKKLLLLIALVFCCISHK